MLRSIFLRAFTRRISALFAVIALSACGGGGGGGSGGGFLPDSGGNAAPTPSFSVTVMGKNGQGEDSSKVAASDPLTIEVLVNDTSSSSATAVVGAIVELTSTVGKITPENASAITDSDGIAGFGIEFDGTEGAGTVTASFTSDGVVYTGTFNVESIVEPEVTPVVSLTLNVYNLAGGLLTKLSQSSPGVVIVSLSSELNGVASPLVGELVRLSTEIGSVSPSNLTALTNSDGEASFGLEFNGTEGAGSVTAYATVGNTEYTSSINLQAEDNGVPFELSNIIFKDMNGDQITTAVLSTEAPFREIAASVVLSDLNGVPLNNRLIQFASGAGQLTPLDGYVLTDIEGRAGVTLEHTDSVSSGITQFTARYVSALGTIEQSADLQALAPDLLLGTIVGTNFTEGAIDSSPASGNLVNQGSGVLRLDIVKGGLDINNASSSDRIKSPQTVAFDSFCLKNGLATLLPSSPVSTSSGELTVTYTAGASCTGEDEVVATLLFGTDTTNQTARQIFTIAAASEVVSLEFADLAPSLIAIKGTGDLVKISEQTQVRFRVVDVNGSPVQGEVVNLALATTVGGLELSSIVATSNAEGLVSVSVASGTLPTQTVVTAELASTGQLVSSDLITVSTGVPDQNSFTLFSPKLSVSQAYVAANMTSTIGVAVADRYNNIVPDGSLIYFTTEYGGIAPSCSINNGLCEVTWRSQNPRPTGPNLSTVDCSAYDNDGDGIANNDAVGTYDPCPIPLGIEQGSRTTILATATGEESFTDLDGDGLMSNFVNEFSDFAHDLGEPYLDENGNGSYDAGEVFVDDDNDGLYDSGDGLFTGIGCSASTLLSGDCTGSLLSVFANIELIMSDSDGFYITLVDDSNPVPKKVDSVTPGSYVAYISDQYNNRPATGATVTIESSGECSIVSPTSFTVGNSNRLGAFAVGIEIDIEADPPASGSISIAVTNPGAPKVTSTFSCATP